MSDMFAWIAVNYEQILAFAVLIGLFVVMIRTFWGGGTRKGDSARNEHDYEAFGGSRRRNNYASDGGGGDGGGGGD